MGRMTYNPCPKKVQIMQWFRPPLPSCSRHQWVYWQSAEEACTNLRSMSDLTNRTNSASSRREDMEGGAFCSFSRWANPPSPDTGAVLLLQFFPARSSWESHELPFSSIILTSKYHEFAVMLSFM